MRGAVTYPTEFHQTTVMLRLLPPAARVPTRSDDERFASGQIRPSEPTNSTNRVMPPFEEWDPAGLKLNVSFWPK